MEIIRRHWKKRESSLKKRWALQDGGAGVGSVCWCCFDKSCCWCSSVPSHKTSSLRIVDPRAEVPGRLACRISSAVLHATPHERDYGKTGNITHRLQNAQSSLNNSSSFHQQLSAYLGFYEINCFRPFVVYVIVNLLIQVKQRGLCRFVRLYLVILEFLHLTVHF